MQEEIVDNDRTQILEITHQLTELMIYKDTEGIRKITDQDFRLTHITGYEQPREEWLAEIKNEGMKYYAYKEVKTSIEVHGAKAALSLQNLLEARIWGIHNTWRLQQTMELEKRNGKWIILKSVATIF